MATVPSALYFVLVFSGWASLSHFRDLTHGHSAHVKPKWCQSENEPKTSADPPEDLSNAVEDEPKKIIEVNHHSLQKRTTSKAATPTIQPAACDPAFAHRAQDGKEGD
jgi:hypothetical protein